MRLRRWRWRWRWCGRRGRLLGPFGPLGRFRLNRWRLGWFRSSRFRLSRRHGRWLSWLSRPRRDRLNRLAVDRRLGQRGRCIRFSRRGGRRQGRRLPNTGQPRRGRRRADGRNPAMPGARFDSARRQGRPDRRGGDRNEFEQSYRLAAALRTEVRLRRPLDLEPASGAAKRVHCGAKPQAALGRITGR